MKDCNRTGAFSAQQLRGQPEGLGENSSKLVGIAKSGHPLGMVVQRKETRHGKRTDVTLLLVRA